MKHQLRRLICALLTAVCLFSIQESVSALSQRGKTIIIVPFPSTSEGPRNPANSPFIAELMNGNTSVLLGATSPCGTVTVHITSTAGDDYSTSFDTSFGDVLLPISGNSGSYLLTITTSDGHYFVGDFTI